MTLIYLCFRNHGHKTIEEDLLSALFKANLITQESYDQAQTMQFQRAARTDKGVSAVRQIVSLKMRKYIFGNNNTISLYFNNNCFQRNSSMLRT